MTDEPLLRVAALSKFYGSRVGCENVTFDLWPGEVLGNRRRIRLRQDDAAQLPVRHGCCLTVVRSLTRRSLPACVDGQFRELYRMSEAERRFLMRTDWGFVTPESAPTACA